MQARFEILTRENRKCVKTEEVMISEVCCILHNMIIILVGLGELVIEEGSAIINKL